MTYYCGKRQKILTEKEVELHHCLARKKGINKGTPCKLLVEI
jgi:hypothetical protein